MIPSPSIAVLGGPGTGKTHFGGQLIGRLRQHDGLLRLAKAPAERTVFDDVQQRLQEGRTADHTPTLSYGEERLPIVDRSGRSFELVWADYGGEQLDRAIEARAVSREWQQRLAGASAWMLFLRLGSVTVYKTDAARLEVNVEKDALPPAGWDWNARLVELLQILLHAANVSIAQRIARPRLCVALSCWDELGSLTGTPRSQLASTLPFVAAFLEANWQPGDLSIWGLSSLGKALGKDTPDAEYIEHGPEHFGYVVDESGRRSTDLCAPVAWLARRA